MLNAYKNQSTEWLLDELIKEANTVEFPSESNLLFELRAEILNRINREEKERDELELSTTVVSRRLYYHKTDGGGEYLTDRAVQCQDGSMEGVFEGATIIMRIDGDITRNAEITFVKESQ